MAPRRLMTGEIGEDPGRDDLLGPQPSRVPPGSLHAIPDLDEFLDLRLGGVPDVARYPLEPGTKVIFGPGGRRQFQPPQQPAPAT